MNVINDNEETSNDESSAEFEADIKKVGDDNHSDDKDEKILDVKDKEEIIEGKDEGIEDKKDKEEEIVAEEDKDKI